MKQVYCFKCKNYTDYILSFNINLIIVKCFLMVMVCVEIKKDLFKNN